MGWDGLGIFGHSGMDWGWGWRWIGFGHSGMDWDLWALKDGLGWIGIFGHSGMGWDWDGLGIFGH